MRGVTITIDDFDGKSAVMMTPCAIDTDGNARPTGAAIAIPPENAVEVVAAILACAQWAKARQSKNEESDHSGSERK